MDSTIFSRARLMRDPRFDGQFFFAVKATGVYCRSTCPTRVSREERVTYFASAFEAAISGYLPCLRCRPGSAPASFNWKNTGATLGHALRLLDSGALVDGSVSDLSSQLGISARDLNRLFQNKLGGSPKQYAQYQQLLFAKSLLQQTRLPIKEIAPMAGFGSVRHFTDLFARSLQSTPSELRSRSVGTASSGLRLFLSYRPPYDWRAMRDFLQARLIPELEWSGTDYYGRSFSWQGVYGDAVHGRFTAHHRQELCGFEVIVEPHRPGPLLSIVGNIRRVLDLDADIGSIDEHLAQLPGLSNRLRPGLRLPGIWDPFEAGIRAILGQQVSVAAARKLVTTLVHRVGPVLSNTRLFPTARIVADARLEFLKMPASRRDTLKRFAEYYAGQCTAPDPDQWQALKGIGPWTVRYARMRGLSDSDVWLGTDLGVRRTLERERLKLDPQAASPWQSYLTFQLWCLM